jgi:DNA polymerase III alpha subunit
MPFTALKGVGVKAVQEITAKQPFANLKDFLSKVDGRKVTSKVFNVLIDSGCTDLAWEGTRKQFISEYEVIKKEISKEKKYKKKQEEEMNEFQGSLFDEF